MLGFSRQWVGWRLSKILLVVLPAAVLFFFLYIWHLGTLMPGLSSHETAARLSSSSIGAIKNDPINAPHKIIQLALQHLGHHGAFWMRSVSILFALLFLVAAFFLLRKWFGKTMATIGTLLFAVTPWVVILARSAASDIMLLSPILALATFVALEKATNRRIIWWFIFMLSIVIVIYSPGGIWFIALSFILGYKRYLEVLTKVKTSLAVLGFVLLLLLISPLAYEAYQNSSIVKSLLLVPHNFPSGLEIFKSVGWSVAALVVKTRQHIDYVVGTLPILNITQTILALIGAYAMVKSARREAYVLLALSVIGIMSAAINENIVLLTLCLPAVAIFDSAAVRFLYVKWFRVFPVNPLPRAFAIILITLLLIINVIYGFRYALAAWPHNPETRKVYMLK